MNQSAAPAREAQGTIPPSGESSPVEPPKAQGTPERSGNKD
jgi:hypothetical protein